MSLNVSLYPLQIVAPFAGDVTKTESKTIKLAIQDGALKGTTIYITNIEAESSIEAEEPRSVRLWCSEKSLSNS